MPVVGRHDDEKIDVAVLVRRTAGEGTKQNNLVGMKFLGDGAGVTTD